MSVDDETLGVYRARTQAYAATTDKLSAGKHLVPSSAALPYAWIVIHAHG